MHTLVLGPLTVHLRESLRKHLSSESKPKSQQLLEPLDPNTCKPKNMSTATLTAFRDCFVQMRNSISPLDKLAHLLTALKVVINSVSYYISELLNLCILLRRNSQENFHFSDPTSSFIYESTFALRLKIVKLLTAFFLI